MDISINHPIFRSAQKARTKSVYKIRLGAVIFKGSKVLAIGFNKSHPLAVKYWTFGTIHAEIDAILNTKYTLLKGASLFVLREHADGTLANAKPCHMCTKVMKEFGLKECYYSTNDNKVIKEMVSEM